MCKNSRCGTLFHSFDANPPCPRCGCVRVGWQPGGGHVFSERTRNADRTVRNLAADFGMTDFNSPSPSRLNRAAKRADHPHPSQSIGVKTFAPGFVANVYHKASAEWSQAPVNLRAATPRIGDSASPFARSATIPDASANAIVQYRHRPRS